ncbi:MAG: hypothetical protein WCO60_19405 [Verrucomicrobiota bacterium]
MTDLTGQHEPPDSTNPVLKRGSKQLTSNCLPDSKPINPPKTPDTNQGSRLVSYDTIRALLEVEGQMPCLRTVARQIRRHSDIIHPVRVGRYLAVPAEQVDKFIARLRGDRPRRTIYL